MGRPLRGTGTRRFRGWASLPLPCPNPWHRRLAPGGTGTPARVLAAGVYSPDRDGTRYPAPGVGGPGRKDGGGQSRRIIAAAGACRPRPGQRHRRVAWPYRPITRSRAPGMCATPRVFARPVQAAAGSAIIPRMSLHLKTPEEIEKMRVAGRLAAEVLEMIAAHVKPGATTEELDRICHDHIVKVQGAVPANVGYRGYPKTVCTSVNNVICHGIPSQAKVLRDGDILNIDVTVIKD